MLANVQCAACGDPVEGEYSIHRDGFCIGPEVWICNGCGGEETPTCCELWADIAGRLADGCTMTVNDGSVDLHCWTGRRDWIEERYGSNSDEWAATWNDDGDSTCMLEAGHSGDHDWTPDRRIGVSFVAAEPDGEVQ
jgi:hypothetical protein